MKNQTKRTIKVLKQLVEDLDGTCKFWACEGHEKMRVKNMITCRICSSIIYAKREIKKLENNT